MISEEDLERERHEARVKFARDEKSRFTSALMRGYLMGWIRTGQRCLNKPLTPREEIRAMNLEQLKRTVAELEQELFGSEADPDQTFQRAHSLARAPWA